MCKSQKFRQIILSETIQQVPSAKCQKLAKHFDSQYQTFINVTILGNLHGFWITSESFSELSWARNLGLLSYCILIDTLPPSVDPFWATPPSFPGSQQSVYMLIDCDCVMRKTLLSKLCCQQYSAGIFQFN